MPPVGTPARKLLRVLVSAMHVSVCSSCALHYVDDAGRERLLGFGHFTVSESTTCELPREHVVTSYGLSLVALPSHGGFSLGYARYSYLPIPNDFLLIEDRDHALQEPCCPSANVDAPVARDGLRGHE